MSTSSFRSPSAYYGGSSNDLDAQDAQDAYHTGPASANSASIPEGIDRPQAPANQQQNTGGAYNWSGNSWQNYGTLSVDPRSYGSDAWHTVNDQNGQEPAYDLQRPQSGHGNLTSNSGASQNFYNSTIHAETQQSTERLNNLAYALGLESAVLQDGGTGTRTGGVESTAFNAKPNTSFPQVRASSPVQSTLPSYSNQRPPSAYSSHGYDHFASSQQDLAASAAAALAGAVSRIQTNQQSRVATHHQPSNLMSSMGNASSRDGNNAQPSYMTSQYGVSASNTSLSTQQSAQHGRAQSPHMNSQTHCSANNSRADMSILGPTTKAQVKTRVSNQLIPPLQNRSLVPENTAQNDRTIANLVANNSSQESLVQGDQRQATPLDALSSFIDPSHISNPYHREYQQKKHDATEMKAAFGVKAHEKSQTANQVVALMEPTNPPQTSSLSDHENPRKGDKSEKESGPALTTPDSSLTSAKSQMTLDSEEDMASEMKAMIERMREWKRKDPARFQKLWDDVKKSGAPTSGPTGAPRGPSPQMVQAALQQTRSGNNPTAASSLNTTTARRAQGPGLPTQLNVHKVVTENNDEGLPDLGRFPAESRYRQTYMKKDADASNKGDEISFTATIDPSLAQPVASGPQPVLQRLETRTSTGSTTWPAEKRQALAESALKMLKAEPANLNKEITAQIIRGMLDQNPSYIDLCKLLEDRGLKFNRGQFAKQLLSNVPDLVTTQSKGRVEPQNSTRTELGRSPSGQALAQAAPMPPTIGATRGYTNSSHHGPVRVEVSPQTPHLNHPFLNQTPNSYDPRSFSTTKPDFTPRAQVVKASLDVPSSILPPPVPGSKDALSRKRNFSELVDLTQLSDDENYVMPSKQPRLQESSPEPKLFTVTGDVGAHGSASAGQASQGHSALAQSLQLNPHQPQKVLAQAPQAAQRPRAILARPIDKSEALRKSYYDPRTVARDILIAAGRHPSERPLNAHFAGLLHRHIELNSDLSTFDWDAVDPGGPPVPQVEKEDIPAGPPKWKLGVQRRRPRNRSEDEPIREHLSHRANPTTSITSLASQSAQTQTLLQDSQKAPLATSQSLPHLRHSQTVDNTTQDDIITTVTPQKQEASPKPFPSPSRTRSSRSASIRERESVESELDMDTPGSKRRGRPPGAKNKHPSLMATKKAAKTSPVVSISSGPRSPPPAHFDVYDCQWRQCHAKLHNLATLRKHISKVHPPSTEEATKWGYTCWWKKCRTLTRNEDKTVTPTKFFQSHSDWMDHIDEDHLHPLGMEKGDGPSTSHIGKPLLKPFDVHKFLYHGHENSCELVARTVSYLDPQSIAADRANYLSDKHGRAVTAPATRAYNNQYAPDALILAPVVNDAEEMVPIKQYLRAHGNEKMDLKTSASEMLRAMEVKKERVGPGMDRGGCTLVNNERRATLLQNEGIARVVVDDD